MTAWLLRAGQGARYAQDWFDHGYVAVYWQLDGLDIARATRDEVRAAVDRLNPDATGQACAMIAGQTHRFGAVMRPGDTVVTYSPSERLYHLGRIDGDCRHTPTPGDDDHGSRYERPVAWLSTAPRDGLSDAARNSLGTIATLSRIDKTVLDELTRAAGATAGPDPCAAEDGAGDDGSAEDAAESRDVTAEEGVERIKDRILALEWNDMERLAAGLLRAMGYRTMLTDRGGDRGRDVIASPDGLGLSRPRIVVEVKHRRQPADAPMLRSFTAGLRDSDTGLYISTGGYTKEARYEADRASVPVALLDLDRFARALIDHYERTDAETRAILPLVRIYWPA